jgi:TolA-binding protein
MKRLIAVTPLLLSACFFPAERGRIVEGRLDTLTEENQKLREALKDTQARLDKATAQLQETVEQLDTASRTTGANIGVKVDSAIQDVAQLRGQVESDQHRMIELEGRLAEMDTRLSSQGTSGAKAEAGKPEPAKPEEKKPDNARDAFKLAEEKARAGDTDAARRLYTELMRKWPKDDLTGEAHFALGETYFTDKKCREALYEYGKVLADFSKTKSAPTAYLRSSECFKDLKMGAESKLALEELVKQHPKSDAAKTAKQRLAELEKPEKKKAPK